MEPPENIFIEPFQCVKSLNFQQGNMFYLQYRIVPISNQFSDPILSNIFDVAFITLTFTQYNNSTDVTCTLQNTKFCEEMQCRQTITSTVLLNNTMLSDVLFLRQQFYKKSIIGYLLKIAFSIYFREHILKSKSCLVCSRKIRDKKTIILLKCGQIAHKKCYKQEHIQATCDDFWISLKALPKPL